MRGSAICTVTSGDPPIRITWLKDSEPLVDHSSRKMGIGSPALAHVQIVSIKDFISSLIIANITRHHQGSYTCVASSPVATTNVTTYLSVRAAPLWRLKPADRNSIAGDSLTLDCQTSGEPAPVTRWKFVKNEVGARKRNDD